ncbi:uncharacterized protein LOC123525592 [Mercenaria mercenaria]|uniref:uncharacterized protein LOC123525592 n=1 Tax=Mercenaria mercenaria TaxID=6596 RepID=UPI00234F9C45|nr:uncharacterized protein LOC123525592 [Mercenaria mercenaria]
MGFSGVRIITGFLLLKCLSVNAQSTIKDIDLKGWFTCSEHPSNQLWLELRAYDAYANATRLNAIDAEEEEITSCTVTGSGRFSSPFVVSSKIDMTDNSEISNVCGMTMTMVNGHKIYSWRVKAYTYPIQYYPNNVGFVLSLQCNTSDLVDGRVETVIDIDVSKLVVSPLDPTSVTGVDSIATNANIIFSAYVYPNGRLTPAELQDAKGIYAYNCYSATSPNMVADRQLFIDEDGCSISGATYATSTSFQQVTNTGDYIKIEAKYAKAVLVNNKKKIYVTCSLGKCTALDEVCCLDPCFANTNNAECNTRTNTGVTYSTSFTVQDRNAHQLTPATASDTTEITSINAGQVFRMIAFNAPGGIGGNQDLLNAKGFYMHTCRYATNAQMRDSTTFVDANGCRVENTKLTLQSDFFTDTTLSSPDTLFVTTSGLITVENVGNIRFWVRCNTGKCLNYCSTRCGATDISDLVDLGYRGHEFTISFLDVLNVPALTINIQGPNGQALTGNSDPVNVGDGVNFGAEVTPGGTGTASAAFVNAKGFFVHSCYAVKNNERQMFIDENGCPVPGSPYRTSKNCVDATLVPGVPPFKVDCGSFIVPEDGSVTLPCNISICTTENNIFCEDRCAAGAVQPDSNVVDLGVTTTAAFNSQIRDDRRTAVRSEELRNIITAVCVVAAVLILLAVTVGTCIVVNRQKSLAKRKLDGRDYNY